MRLIARWLAVAALATLPATAHAQKKVLTQADWDIWKSIQGAAISNDGKWAMYTLAPLVGDGELILRATQGATEYRVPRGYIGRPNNVPGGLRPRSTGNPEDDPQAATSTPGQFTADSKFALVLTYPTKADFDRAARNRRQAALLQNRADLAIVSLADGKVTTVPRVRSFRLPSNNGAWVAYVAEDSTAPVDSAARGGRGGAPADSASRGGARRQYGTTLTLRNLGTGAEERIADVVAFVFDDSAKVMAYTVASRQPGKDGAFVRTLAAGATSALLTGTGDYKGLAFDRGAKQLAFFTNRDEFGKPRAGYAIYYGSLNGPATLAVAPAAVGRGMRVSDNANLAFTRTGNAITFGVAPILPDSVPSDSLQGKAVFDLWHFKDPQLQPTQRLNAVRDRSRSFQSVYFTGTKKLVTLASDTLPQVSIGDDGRVVLGTSRERYNIESMWGDGATDVYVIDGTTGAAKLVREHISGNAQLSPEDKYIAFFDKGHWYTYNTSTGKTVDLEPSAKGVHFEQTIDRPDTPGPWGIAGWTKGDRTILVYDQYDLWEVDPTGAKPAVIITDSLGTRNKTVLRLVQLGGGGGRGGGGGGGRGGGGGGGNDTLNVFDANAPLFLHAMNEDTKAAGFYRDQLGATRAPERVVMGDVSFGTPLKAKNAEQYLITKGTYTEFPNLYTGPSLTNLTRLSDANPQQKDYNWASVELVRWISTDGHEQKGLLYKPENFDPSKKYPMVSYFYEQLSNNLHNYVAPNGRNVINPTHYASNGYLVFEPDIHYEVGYPGPSAMKSIIPGVQMLLARGYVDPKRLGLQGQSWGGYQTLYMITQSQMFAAAMAGAPVVNMTSAYGGIRWGSGIARSGQYESGQSRIGGSIWEYPTRFIENSPLFWLDRVTTPLFIMANDADDAVPWYQGIETFVGMRRLGKEVYFISYNNDVHNPQSRANQKDIAMRMQQFFDNKLKGAPAPDWMVHGIPYRDKGRDQIAGALP